MLWEQKLTGVLPRGRCNNVLWISAASAGLKKEDAEMSG